MKAPDKARELAPGSHGFRAVGITLWNKRAEKRKLSMWGKISTQTDFQESSRITRLLKRTKWETQWTDTAIGVTQELLAWNFSHLQDGGSGLCPSSICDQRCVGRLQEDGVRCPVGESPQSAARSVLCGRSWAGSFLSASPGTQRGNVVTKRTSN